MTANYARQIQQKAASEARNVSVGFLGELDSGELLSGTPTVTEVTTSDLTISSEAVNSSSILIGRITHTAGQAVQFAVSGGTAGTLYTIKIAVSTDGSPAQDLVVNIRLRVTADS